MRIFLMMFFSLMVFMLSATSVVVKPNEILLNYDNDVGIEMPSQSSTLNTDAQLINFNIDNYSDNSKTSQMRVTGILSNKELLTIKSVFSLEVEYSRILFSAYRSNSNLYRNPAKLFKGYTFAEINILDRN